MSESRVTIHSANGEGDRTLDIRVNGESANFEIKSDRLEARFGRNLDSRLSDFLKIVSCIFATDSRVSRGTSLRSSFGNAWRRRMSFRIAVREPDFWDRPEIKTALIEAVEFMSDDTLELQFERAATYPPSQGMFDFGSYGPVFSADEVILFSGGLDSLAGTYERLASAGGNIILLSHISANKRIAYAKTLVDQLKAIFPGRILWIPISAHLKGVDARETTQRTRSLLFACLGFVTAKLSGARRIHFYENGIVSANLPISAQVIGTMASRTTHPQTLQRLAALLHAIAPGEVELTNPFGTLTKAEVSRRLADLGGANLIRHSVSCSHVRQQTILHPHCGACSQCLDRRFGILAAGLAAHDPVEGYEINVLTDPRPKDDERILALDWTRHALRLSKMSETDFLAAFGTELARLVAARPELSAAEHARSIVAMHRTHGEGVCAALSSALTENSDSIVKQTLPETSLLRMIVADRAALPAQFSSIPYQYAALASDDANGANTKTQRVRISGSAEFATVVIEGLGEVSGLNATPAWALAPYHLADREADVALDKFQFVTGGKLAQDLKSEKMAVRQRVKRLRDEFARFFEVVEGFPPAEPILIQNRGTRGYRLDPQLDIKDDPLTDRPHG